MDLDSAIWLRAHDDTIYNIIEQSDRPSQIKWAATNSRFHNFCVPKIWHTLRLYGRDFDAGHVHGPDGYITKSGAGDGSLLPGIIHGPDGYITESGAGNDSLLHGIIYFLLEYHNYSSLIPPTLCINTLHIDGFGTNWRQVANPAFVVMALPRIASSLLSLANLIVDGDLPYDVIRHLGRMTDLTTLCLRGSDGYCEGRVSYSSSQGGYKQLGPGDCSGRLGCIESASLQTLQSLRVGRLTYREAGSLATAIEALRLTTLEVCASVWSTKRNDLLEVFERDSTVMLGPGGLVFPIIVLLANLIPEDTVVAGNPWEESRTGKWAGNLLPASIKHLILTDRYHWYISGYYNFLQAALRTCAELKSMTNTLFSRNALADVFGELPSPEHPVRKPTLALPNGKWQMSDNNSMEQYGENVLVTNGLHVESAFEGRIGIEPVSECEAFHESQADLAKGADLSNSPGWMRIEGYA